LWFPLTAPYLSLAAAHDTDAGMLTLFALNRNVAEEMSLNVATSGFGVLAIDHATQLRHDNLDAVNTKEHPDRVTPSVLDGVSVSQDHVQVTLAPASWNVIRLRIAR
jgi:alpha-N-arabinofuranosidase